MKCKHLNGTILESVTVESSFDVRNGKIRVEDEEGESSYGTPNGRYSYTCNTCKRVFHFKDTTNVKWQLRVIQLIGDRLIEQGAGT